MSRDRTLEEFVPTEESTDAAPEEETADRSPATRDSAAEDVGTQSSEADATDDDQPDPLLSTYAYDESGGPCATCGETTTERWRDETGLVCGDCKEW